MGTVTDQDKAQSGEHAGGGCFWVFGISGAHANR